MTEELKKCSCCKETLPVEMFSRNKSRKDGLCDSCKSCSKSYREINKEVIAEKKRVYREINKKTIAERKRY